MGVRVRKRTTGSPGQQEAGEMVVGAEGPFWAEEDTDGVKDKHQNITSTQLHSDAQGVAHGPCLLHYVDICTEGVKAMTGTNNHRRLIVGRGRALTVLVMPAFFTANLAGKTQVLYPWSRSRNPLFYSILALEYTSPTHSVTI